MKKNIPYSVVLGITAGAAFTAASALLGLQKAKKMPDEPDPEQILKVKGTALQSQNGEKRFLRLMAAHNSTLPPEIRQQLKTRFGAYGMAQVVKTYEDAYYGAEDLKKLREMGFTGVMLDLTPTALYGNGKHGKRSKKPDFSRLEERLALCRECDMTAVLRLADTLFFEKKEKAQKNALSLWADLAAHCQNDPTVAAYLIAPRTVTNQEKALDNARYCKAVKKAIRKADTGHLILLEEAEGISAPEIIGSDANCGTLRFCGEVSEAPSCASTASYPTLVCFCSHGAVPAPLTDSNSLFGYEGYKSLRAECGIMRRYAYQPEFTSLPYEELCNNIKAEYSASQYEICEDTVNSLAAWLTPEVPVAEKKKPSPFITFGIPKESD